MQNWFRNSWLHNAGVLLVAAGFFLLFQTFWLNPKIGLYESLMRQVQEKDFQIKQVIARMPDLLKMKRNLAKEEQRLTTLRTAVHKMEGQMLAPGFVDSMTGRPDAIMTKTNEMPGIYSQANYSFEQRGNYQDLLTSINQIENASPFLKISSLILEKAANQILLHTDFAVLMGTQKENQVRIQAGHIEHLPVVTSNPFKELFSEEQAMINIQPVSTQQ